MLPAPHPWGGVLPPGDGFPPQRNNKKCPSPPFQETETLKLLPSDSCSPCAKHFLTATNLGLSLYILQDSTGKINIFFAGPYNFCRRPCICPPTGECSARPARFSLHPPFALEGPASPTARFLFFFAKGIFRARATAFAHGGKGCKNAAKNQWFLEFLSSDCSCGAKGFRSESPLRLPSLPLTWHAESNGRPPVWAIIKSRTAASGGKCRCGRWAAPPSAEHSF